MRMADNAKTINILYLQTLGVARYAFVERRDRCELKYDSMKSDSRTYKFVIIKV